MSERTPNGLTISTRNVSIDGTRIQPGDTVHPTEISVDAALQALQAFAAQPAMALVEAEAKIFLSGPRGKVAVQNQGGKLFVTIIPEMVNTAAEYTPEQTIALLTADLPAQGAPTADLAAQDAEILAMEGRRSSGWRALRRSPWVLAVLWSVAATIAYFSFAPETPEGVTMVHDPARVAELHKELNGRYGDPTVMVLSLEGGKLLGRRATATGTREETIFERTYHFGLRGNQVVLVADNGAVFEVQPDRRLVFLDSSYPRLAK